MNFFECLFWVCLGCVAYPYVLYPLALKVLAGLRPRPVAVGGGDLPSVSVVLAVRDEEEAIVRRLGEFAAAFAASGLDGEVIVVSDGSTDGTAGRARGFTSAGVRVIELSDNAGKSAALSEGCAAARSEILVFADARQTWKPDALRRLLENFADAGVGAVGGALVVESEPGVLAGVGLYWRFESWLRRQESLIHSTVGVSGSIAAVRRSLFRPIPRGTILDDVYWPLRVAMQGRRVVYDARAVANDRLPDNPRDEFRRKVRTLSGNFQLLARLPSALLPTRNPIWLAFLSHKVARLAVPWALLSAFVLCFFLEGPFYRAALVAQAVGHAFGLLGLCKGVATRSRLAAAAGSFLMLNAAAWVAFWVWASGRTSRSWRKARYARPILEGAAR